MPLLSCMPQEHPSGVAKTQTRIKKKETKRQKDLPAKRSLIHVARVYSLMIPCFCTHNSAQQYSKLRKEKTPTTHLNHVFPAPRRVYRAASQLANVASTNVSVRTGEGGSDSIVPMLMHLFARLAGNREALVFANQLFDLGHEFRYPEGFRNHIVLHIRVLATRWHDVRQRGWFLQYQRPLRSRSVQAERRL